jgi:hypothetical protein
MIVWNDDQKSFLRTHWNAGNSTKQIGDDFGRRFGCTTDKLGALKNAMVGKAHRLAIKEPGLWIVRDSPIRHGKTPKKSTLAACQPPPAGAVTLPNLPSLGPNIVPFQARRQSVIARVMSLQPPPPTVRASPQPPSATAEPQPYRSEFRCEARDPNVPLRRRDDSGCRWPLGGPGKWCYCDAGLYSLTRPYCLQHTKMAVTSR